MPCPLVAAYLRGVRRNLSDKDKTLYEDLFESLDELEEQCKDSTSSDTDRRIRAFFCIELMSDAVPKTLLLQLDQPSLGEYDSFIKKFENPKFERSWSGLTVLIDAIDEFEREVVLESEEIRATFPSRAVGSISAMIADSLSNSEGKLNQLRRAASILRRDLKDPINEVHKVGSITAEFMKGIGSPGDQLAVCRQLLLLNIHTVEP